MIYEALQTKLMRKTKNLPTRIVCKSLVDSNRQVFVEIEGHFTAYELLTHYQALKKYINKYLLNELQVNFEAGDTDEGLVWVRRNNQNLS